MTTTAPRPYYVIEHRWPIYDHRDALVGSRGKLLPMHYRSQRLAQKIAGRLCSDSWEDGGHDYFEVLMARPDGYPVKVPLAPYPDNGIGDEEIPF